MEMQNSGDSGSWGSWCLSPAVYGQEAGYTLDRSPVHRRTTQTHSGPTTMLFLDCGTKLEYPERTHACTGENMQTPCKIPGRESNPVPCCWKASPP
ncbi:hypothetical protein CHARACLAT_029070 [Characodon lateralis]|uniref:Uncharacterized protein n=1 Tax=Characodon lateralis TaxID=208331 RepID=A0ABU7CW85_9TELE|nr:hypothetical protein [Characodon lateralis]